MENYTYGIYDPLGVRLLNRLRLGSTHLGEHKFRHNFPDTLNPLYSYSLEYDIFMIYLLSTLPKQRVISHNPYECFKQYQCCNSVFEFN